MAERRQYSREFKVEAVRLVSERGVSVTQAARDLGVHVNMLRKWVRACGHDASSAFPGQGVLQPEQAEIARLKKEVAKLRMERDILKKAAAFFAQDAL
jgi:transposase